MTWHAVPNAASLGDDEVVRVSIGGAEIALCRVAGGYYAIGDICTHQHARLSDGYLEDGCIECPLHQGRFDVRTGAALGAPVSEPVKTYPVKVEDGVVFVDV